MVTCQSDNQLKTKVSWFFTMVSQFGSLGDTIMGKIADLTVVQKTIIDTLYKEGKTQTFITKEAVHRVLYPSMLTESWVEEKDAQPTERTAAYEDCQEKSIQEFVWTSRGMDWGWGQGIKSTTHRRVEEFGYSYHQRRLTWTKKKKNWTVVQWSKVLFSDESKFCVSFGNQGPRVWRKGEEAQSPSCLKSSVKFTQSVMIWGAMSSAGVGPLCFFENQRHCTRLPRNSEHFMLPSADQLFKDADFIFLQDLAEGHCQINLGFTPPQQCHKLITSTTRRIERVIKAKWAPTKYWVHVQ